jgi:hypothetical protein
MTMQHLSAYSVANDSQREDEEQNEEARSAAIAEREQAIVEDHQRFIDVIAEALYDGAAPSECDFLAGLFVQGRCDKPAWFSAELQNRGLRAIQQFIGETVRKAAETEIDNEYAEQQRQRREGSGE